MMTHNKKGMTLIEIIVVLLISSIAMVIAGSIILNSMQYFEKTASTDRDKLVTDGIADFVRDELMYASDVRIVTKEQAIKLGIHTEEWQRFSIDEDGYLEHNEKLAFTEDYYNNNQLMMKVKGVDNDYHINLDFALTNAKGKQGYRTDFTLDLINVKAAMSKDDDFNPFSELKDVINLTSYRNNGNKYYVYYKKGEVPISKKDENTGTVEDALLCKTGEGKSFKDTSDFVAGDFVYIINTEGEKDWYQCIKKKIKKGDQTSILKIPGFRRVSKEWSNYSAYIKDDVVIGVDGYYYRCIENIEGGKDYASMGEKPGVGVSSSWTKTWKRLESSADVNKDKDYCSIPDNDELDGTGSWTVGGEKDRCGIANNIADWKDRDIYGNVIYKKGDFIEYPKNSNNWYRAMIDNLDNGNTPDKDSHRWKKITEHFDNDTPYYPGDIVKYKGRYYQVIKVINVGWNPEVYPDGWFKDKAGNSGFLTPEDLIKASGMYPDCNALFQ